MFRALAAASCRFLCRAMQSTRIMPSYSSPLLHCVLEKTHRDICQKSYQYGTLCSMPTQRKFIQPLPLVASSFPVQLPQVRTVTKFSLRKGKRKSVKTVLRRFYRLDWGVWIRTHAGRHKRMWKKSGKQRSRAKKHVFTNSTQSYLLDKMVTSFWRRRKYYVDDPYEPYHSRENFPLTRKKPAPKK